MSLEDMQCYPNQGSMKMNNPDYRTYPFLSDNPNPQNYDDANFKFVWQLNWHPSVIVQFSKGNFYHGAFVYPHKAVTSACHFSFKANTWYQFSLSWDYEAEHYSLYVNGILIGREDQYRATSLAHDKVNPSLFTGNPTLCYSDICFYDQTLTPSEIEVNFRKEHTHFDAELDKEMRYTYLGEGREKFTWLPDKSWVNSLNLSLQTSSDRDSLYLQGNPVDLHITDEGMLFETLNKEYTGALLDSQAYVWTKKPFEGDLYVEYEFKVLRRGGLSLLMVQASGMNREDFMSDYPLKTTGSMITVFGENVRNYHWEYYREMIGIRNDIQNSVLVKNPFLYPVCYGAIDKPFKLNEWNKLQFRQIGNKLIGAINGVVMVEYADTATGNNGPVYNAGHIAIRCMIRSKILFRNLKVYNRSQVDEIRTLNN
jgi:hypothetical protein